MFRISPKTASTSGTKGKAVSNLAHSVSDFLTCWEFANKTVTLKKR